MDAGALVARLADLQVLSEAQNDPITNWPGWTVVTSLPTSSTIPTYS